MADTSHTTGTTDVRASLAHALTFHASFDNGPDADFALGDKHLYSAPPTDDSNTDAALIPGLGEPPLAILHDQGRFGAALEFTREQSHRILFKAEQNVAYAEGAFQGTASFWLSTDPAEIPVDYSDPFQLTDKNYDNACIWVDFTKNDTPSDFRLGVFGNKDEWDITTHGAKSEEFFFRLAKIAEPPFAKGAWTHVVITWEGLDSAQGGRARLYLNGDYRASSGLVREHFTWNPANATIRLGTGHFVGLFDDIAIFNRALTADEIRALYGLDHGVAELH